MWIDIVSYYLICILLKDSIWVWLFCLLLPHRFSLGSLNLIDLINCLFQSILLVILIPLMHWLLVLNFIHLWWLNPKLCNFHLLLMNLLNSLLLLLYLGCLSLRYFIDIQLVEAFIWLKQSMNHIRHCRLRI